MHQLNINVKVKGSVTEDQLANMAMSLYASIDNYLSHLPLKTNPTTIVWEGEGLLGKYVVVGGEK